MTDDHTFESTYAGMKKWSLARLTQRASCVPLAEEAFHDAFLVGWERRSAIPGEYLERWMSRAMSFKLNNARRRRAEHGVAFDEIAHRAPGPSALDVLELAERRRWLERAIARLAPDEQAAVRAWLENGDTAAVQRALGADRARAHAVWTRALRKLRAARRREASRRS